MKKRILATVLAGAMVFGLAGCGGGSDAPATQAAATTAAEAGAEKEEQVYSMVEDDNELAAVSGVFESMLDDIDLV